MKTTSCLVSSCLSGVGWLVLTCLVHVLLSAMCCPVQGPGDEHVWRQLLQHHLVNSDPEVAQQAAAALVES
jgi:hypothetical protein